MTKTIIILIAIIAITIPISASAMIESWIDYDCDTLTKGMTPICNDINTLNYRIINLENTHVEITDFKTLNIPINIPFTIENFTANVNEIDWTDKITLDIFAPNNTMIYSGTQPTTFTPDRNGAWDIEAHAGNTIEYWQLYTSDGVPPIINMVLDIQYGDTGDYLQVNATGFYPYDEIIWYTPTFYENGIVLADNQGNISVTFTENLQDLFSIETTIDVQLLDIPTSTKTFASILYDPIQELQ